MLSKMLSISLLKSTASPLPHHDLVLSPEILYVLRNCVSAPFSTRKKLYE